MRKVSEILINLYLRVGVAMLFIFLACTLALFAGAFVTQVVTVHVPEIIEYTWMCSFAISLGFLMIHTIGMTLVQFYGDAKWWFDKRFT